MGSYYSGMMNNEFGYGELRHHGILGQKWGVRRFQNKDGTLTEEGKKRYGYKETRHITDSGLSNFVDHIETTSMNIYSDDGYREAKINNEAAKKLDKIIENAYKDSKLEEARLYTKESSKNLNKTSTALFDRKRGKKAFKDATENERDAMLEYTSLIGDKGMKYINSLPKNEQNEAMLYLYRHGGFDW